MKQTQRGFAIFELLIAVFVIVIIAVAGFFFVKNKPANKDDGKTTSISTTSSETNTKTDSAKIKHLGVNLDYYDPATKKAGDFLFTNAEVFANQIFMNYGYLIPASPDYPAKRNPQPTFFLPLGTKVHSLVDGKVFRVPKLYSDDYSVQVQTEGSELIFEAEHVVNVKVKEGDTVKAGDIIAEVSPFGSQSGSGLGLFEIGILKGGNPPSHICPFDYLDDSIKDDLLKKITAFQKSWEEYKGNSNIYDESQVVIPGCVSRDPIEG
ncbi:M23 family metallopeptidase [Candidatus Saccharibacteria bacterium]|nr:M23 family metallopeptidase [Candidatus Saccharibacteria bacterium]